MKHSLPPQADLKMQAKRLRAQLATIGAPVTHSQSLELIAKQYSCRDWNTLCAQTEATSQLPVNVGAQISGHYLSMPFKGKVRGLEVLNSDRFRISIDFDTAVDVVSFESFSALRKRVTCVINSAGRTAEKTSNGMPHLVLDLS